MRRLLFTIPILLFFSLSAQAQYFTRTGHFFVESSSKLMNIKANNYQVMSLLDPETGAVSFTGLIKSFEFDLGLADRMFSKQQIGPVEQPKITFEGKLRNPEMIDFNTPGTYLVDIDGILRIWGYQRLTSAKGELRVQIDGSVKGKSSFSMRIEEESKNKINELMRQYLPSIVKIDAESLGIDRDIQVEVNVTYTPQL